MYVAFDDTDSTEGMCTTFLATEMILGLADLDLIGLPRLVRLNPAVPWKTRGNGAVCLRFGKGRGGKWPVGGINDEPIYSHAECAREPDIGSVLDTCSGILKEWSRVGEGASPGLVVSKRKPPQWIYWSTVRRITRKADVLSDLKRLGARTASLAGGRGIVGASAAMAWRPRDRTYEVLAYREKDRWGTEREVSPGTVEELDSLFPSTFNNYDHIASRPAITPNSPCPVLFGIRGDALEDLVPAMSSIRSEPVDRWLLFLTNQGTDDHIITDWDRLVPGSSYSVEGEVTGRPETFKGGHVVFQLLPDRGGALLDCAAYEPSKHFRDTVRLLAPGDRVQVFGEVRKEPRTLNIEKLHVTSLAEVSRKGANPSCPVCGKRMKSVGVGQGYRCRRCGSKAPPGAAELVAVPREIAIGWYEPPVCSRRHLSKPLKRLPPSAHASVDCRSTDNIQIETKS